MIRAMFLCSRPGRVVLTVIAFLLPTLLHAGFDLPNLGIKGVPVGGSRADKDALEIAQQRGVPYEAITTPIPAADLAKLKAHPDFAGMSNTQIHLKVVNMRRAVLCVIELIKRENRKIGDGLERAFRGGLICIGLASADYKKKVGAAILNDGKKTFNMEPINLYRLPCSTVIPPQEWQPEFFELLNTMAHEGLHAIQEIKAMPGPLFRLDLAKKIQCAEIEASEAELKRTCEMLRILAAVANSAPIPDDASGLQLRIAVELRNSFRSSPTGRANAIASLQKRCRAIKARAELVRDFRKLYKKAAELAIAGNPNAAQIRTQLRKHRLFGVYGRHGEFGDITNFYFNRAGTITGGQLDKNREMRQLVPPDFEQEESFDVLGVDSICDALILGDVNLALIGGVQDGTGPGGADEGVIVAIDLDPVTGQMLPKTQRECLRTPMLGTGFRLALNTFEKGSQCYALKLPGGDVCRLHDGDGDGCPDNLTHVGGFAVGQGEELSDFRFLDQNTLVGFPFDEDSVFPEDGHLFFTVRPDPAAPFAPAPHSTMLREVVTRPTLNGIPYVDLTTIPIAGTANSRCEVFYTNPEEKVGEGCISPVGRGFIDLDVPIPEDRELFLRDLDTGLESERFICVPRSDGIVRLNAEPVDVGRNLGWRLEYEPNRQVEWREGDDFDNAPIVRWTSANAWGRSYHDTDLDAPGTPPTGVILADIKVDPAPGGVPDSFTAAPGVPTVFDVSLNDGAPEGTEYVLDGELEINEDRFKWNRDGTFTVSLLTLGGQISFTYLQARNGLVGPPVTVLVQSDISALTNPPILDGPGGVPWVEVPVLALAPVPLATFNYPLYQFVLGNSPFDVCVDPHWHAFSPVSPIENEILDVPDPDEFECGFGLLRDNLPIGYMMPLSQWNAFKAANPP